MKIFLTILIFSFIGDLAYIYLKKIRFNNYKARINNLYCHLAVLNNLPEDPVIFVPGIKGSVLQNRGETVWLGLFNAVFGSSLKYTENDGVEAVGVFTGVILAPFLEYQPYYSITANLACSPNAYFFYYDWRDYPDVNSKKFGELVERVIKETGKRPSIVAHSMGGLVAHSYIKENPENINRVVYISVPFQPGVGYFDDVNDGARVGLNSKLLSKDVTFSHPASYLLMPHKGSGRYYGKELMEAKTWSDNKFSVFKDGNTDLDKFQKVLDRVADYHKLLDTPKVLKNRFLIIVGECYKTVLTPDRDGIRSYFPGDGRVSEVSSYPLDTLTDVKKEVFCTRHDSQMNDKKIVAKIFEFLNSS